MRESSLSIARVGIRLLTRGRSTVFFPLACWAALLAMTGAPDAVGAPIFGEVFSHRQPDGTSVDVRIWGDEFYRVVESLDGYTLVPDPETGMACYATLSPDGDELVSTGVPVAALLPAGLDLTPHIRINRAASEAIIAEQRGRLAALEAEMLRGRSRSAPPSTGEVQAIVLLVDFSDEPGTIPPSEVDDFCNLVGYGNHGNYGSVRDYFYDVSDGNLTYTNYVPGVYYRAQHPKTYYEDPDYNRAQELVLEALIDLDAQGFDFSAYDSNGDGLVDGVNCFYAGPCRNAWAQGLWPHSSWISYATDDGVSTGRYQMTDMSSWLTLGTFCHENGHMMCYWPDLYDYGYDSAGVGRFCIMCNYTSQTNPQEPCAYMKYVAGWANAILLESSQVGLPVPSDENTIYKYAHPTQANEYYLIENRRKSGRDAGIPDAGLAIWHVDEYGSNDNQQMTPELHYKVTLVQADGDWDLEHNRNSGDSDDLWTEPDYTMCTPFTAPNTSWWDGSESGLFVTEISAASSTMTFTFGSPADCNGNGIADFLDTSEGTSADCNGDTRPDECGVLNDCQLVKLTAPDAEPSFGGSVALNGDVAVVGAWGDDDAAGGSCGSAYVYRFDGVAWAEEEKLTASDAAAGDQFGYSVGASGDVAVVGAWLADCAAGVACGAAYVYRFNGTSWIEEAKLTAPDAAAQDYFGTSIAVDADLIVVGAYEDDCVSGTGCGAAYVYRYDSTPPAHWEQEAKLTASDADQGDWFGASVSASNQIVAVGAYGDDCPEDEGDCGAAYVYRYDGGAWIEESKLSGADGYGYPVSINVDHLVVGAPWRACSAGSDCGEAYIYHYYVEGTWAEGTTRSAPEAAAGDFFGRSVSLGGDLAVVTATGTDCAAGESCGSASVFYFDGYMWVQVSELTAADAAAYADFGRSAAVNGDTVVVGAFGAAYLFAVRGEDCNCNGATDICDVLEGTSLDDNDNGAPDECEVAASPLPVPYPHNRAKNRYLTFDPNKPENDGLSVAFRVTLTSLRLGSCDTSGSPNVEGWPCRSDDDCRACSATHSPCISASVDCPPVPPQTCELTGATCVNDQAGSVGRSWWVGPEHPTLGNGVHLLVSEPYRKVSSAWPPVVHVADCEVVPAAIYEIVAVDTDMAGDSTPLEVRTAARPDMHWADCVGPLGSYCAGSWRACVTSVDCGYCYNWNAYPVGHPNNASSLTSCTSDADCPLAGEFCGTGCLEQWPPPDGFINFQDVTAAVFTFAMLPGLPSTDVENVDLHGNDAGDASVDPPNYVINFTDIANLISAFQGRPYPYADPADCPDVTTWP